MPNRKKKPGKSSARAARPKSGGKSDLAKLYRELGYVGPLPGAPTAKRARVMGAAAAPADEGPLSPTRLRELEKAFAEDPAGTLDVVRRSLGYGITEIEFRKLLAKARVAMAEPAAFASSLRRRKSALFSACKPPSDIPTYPDIKVEPCSMRYEPVGDALGWLVNCGPYWLKQKLRSLRTAPFPHHNGSASFVYDMKSPQGTHFGANDTIRIALFSDFGTGEYQSLYVAKKIAEAAPDYAIHLGDVYYSGRPAEVRKHLEAPLRPLLDLSRVFVLNANHEMLSGGFGYFEYLKRKRDSGARVQQEQEGSYFSLVSPGYQVIAIDTAYDYVRDGELVDARQEAWLAERLREGKLAGRTNILLTQHEPFGLGKAEPQELLRQIARLATQNAARIDYWFWGDEHYCALYGKSATVPFVGSCIGHAGYPVDLRDVAAAMQSPAPFAKHLWVDTSPRFDRLRGDELGNSGYCMLELGPSGVKLDYRSWIGRSLKTFP